MSHKDERRKSRQDRLGAALRDNLRRRKAQVRGGDGAGRGAAPSAEPAGRGAGDDMEAGFMAETGANPGSKRQS